MSGKRRILSAVALGVGLALLMPAETGLAAARPRGLCPKPFADPRMSLRLSTNNVRVGEHLTLAGNLVRNGCPIPGQLVGLFTREGPGPFTFQASRVTDARGEVQFRRSASRSFDAMLIFSKTATYARTESRVVHVTVTKQAPPKIIYLAGCHLPKSLPIGYKAPTGVRVDLLLDERSVRAGDTLTGAVKITNYLPDPLVIDEVEGARAAILQNIKTGELATPTYFTDAVSIVRKTIRPRRSISVPIAIKTVTCQDPVLGPRIHAGTYDVIASVELTVLGVRTTWVPDVKTVKVTN